MFKDNGTAIDLCLVLDNNARYTPDKSTVSYVELVLVYSLSLLRPTPDHTKVLCPPLDSTMVVRTELPESPFTLPGEVRRGLLLSLGSILYKMEGGAAGNANGDAGARKEDSDGADNDDADVMSGTVVVVEATNNAGTTCNARAKRFSSTWSLGGSPRVPRRRRTDCAARTASDGDRGVGTTVEDVYPVSRSRSDGKYNGNSSPRTSRNAGDSFESTRNSSSNDHNYDSAGENEVTLRTHSRRIQRPGFTEGEEHGAEKQAEILLDCPVLGCPDRRWSWGGLASARDKRSKGKKKTKTKKQESKSVTMNDMRSMLREHNTPPTQRKKMPSSLPQSPVQQRRQHQQRPFLT